MVSIQNLSNYNLDHIILKILKIRVLIKLVNNY